MTTPLPRPDAPGTTDTASDAIHDAERLQEIADLRLLDSDTAKLLQDLVDEAAAALDLPVVLVSVVLDDAQHFAAAHGLAGWLARTRGTPIEWSFCAHAVEGNAPFVVPDAPVHPLVKDNPLVTVDGFRCYAGVPLRTGNGQVVGTLCALGTEERRFTDAEIELLEGIAARVVERLEARRS